MSGHNEIYCGYTREEIETDVRKVNRLLEALRCACVGFDHMQAEELGRVGFRYFVDLVEDALEAHATMYELAGELADEDIDAREPISLRFKDPNRDERALAALTAQSPQPQGPDWMDPYLKLPPERQARVAACVREEEAAETRATNVRFTKTLRGLVERFEAENRQDTAAARTRPRRRQPSAKRAAKTTRAA